MQIKNKKLFILLAIILFITIALIIFVIINNKDDKDKIKTDYYYNFTYDDNLVTQSVWIYNKDDELQTKYMIMQDDQVIAYTKGEKAVLVMQMLDLKDHPTIEIKFEDDKEEKIHKVEYHEKEE